MPETTITIDRDQRDGLYELVRNHLEIAEDLRLLEDLGWGDDGGQDGFALTMPRHA